MDVVERAERLSDAGQIGWALAVIGSAMALGAFFSSPDHAREAAAQDWPPFVLVAGLLLVGSVAEADGLFSAMGQWAARRARHGIVLYGASVVLVLTVTATLNLDTSVAFLTPVLVYAARARGGGEAPLLYGCLLLSNAGSLLLPGSNLTNLIVLAHLHQSGGDYFGHMAPAALAAALITAVVVGVAERKALGRSTRSIAERQRPEFGIGVVAVVTVTVLVLVLRSPALPVAAVGLVAATSRRLRRSSRPEHPFDARGLSVLVGLFAVALALGTVGRSWSAPARVLAHASAGLTAIVAAGISVVVNNLPAASLLAARVPPRPYALLVGLNLGPNLFVTGSLSWFLWLRTARAAGATPSVARASLNGLISVPLSMAAALAILSVNGSH